MKASLPRLPSRVTAPRTKPATQKERARSRTLPEGVAWNLLFVGLTGGIGSGKSEALDAFARLGAAVLSSDEVVHELLAGSEVRDLLSDRWGERVVADGEIDRAAVAEIVFDR